MIKRFSKEEIPKTLYKYRDWSNKFHRKLITHQEIYFPKPSEFNDPFDGNIPVRWDLMTYEECLEKNYELIRIAFNNQNQQLIRERAKQMTDEKTFWHPEMLAKEGPEKLEKWNSLIGLFSLSAVPDNILMWSHYSLNHTGFVIGFDTDSLTRDYEFDYIESISYQPKYPLISGTDDSNVQFHKKFFSKSEHWIYEKEWRISKNHIKKRIIKLKPETISQIIIGCCTDNETENKIIKLGKKHLGNEVQIFKAEKANDDFGLTLVRL